MSFCEPLPKQCPPPDAQEGDLETLYRLVENDPVQEEDFWSHEKLGKSRPKDVDECRWASCSLLSEKKARSIQKNKRHKHKKMLAVNVRQTHGRWTRTDEHVDFWRYQSVPYTELL